MAEPSEEELARIAAERAEMFRPRWIGRLARGELGLGETFWGGHLGMQLCFMPLWLVMVVAVPAVFPTAGWGSWLVFFVAQALWSLTVTRGVIRVAPGATGAGGWRWVAVAVSALLSLQALGWLWVMLTDPPQWAY